MTNQTLLAMDMKRGMRQLASGVAVLAARDVDGRPYAMTVSSITSVTDQPPSLLVCLHQQAQTHDVIKRIDGFSVNILSSAQRLVSETCAGLEDMDKRFSIGHWGEEGEQRLPFLVDALAVFFCVATQRIQYGTHMIVIADIHSVKVSDSPEPPLVYCRGKYQRFYE